MNKNALIPSTRGHGGVLVPMRDSRRDEVEVTFYCSDQRLSEIRELCKKFYGDEDTTKSISRILTAGVHWMQEHNHEIQWAMLLRTELEDLERQKAQLQLESDKRKHRPWYRRLLG